MKIFKKQNYSKQELIAAGGTWWNCGPNSPNVGQRQGGRQQSRELYEFCECSSHPFTRSPRVETPSHRMIRTLPHNHCRTLNYSAFQAACSTTASAALIMKTPEVRICLCGCVCICVRACGCFMDTMHAPPQNKTNNFILLWRLFAPVCSHPPAYRHTKLNVCQQDLMQPFAAINF